MAPMRVSITPVAPEYAADFSLTTVGNGYHLRRQLIKKGHVLPAAKLYLQSGQGELTPLQRIASLPDDVTIVASYPSALRLS